MEVYLKGNYKSFIWLKIFRAKIPVQKVVLNIHGLFGFSGDKGSKSALLGKKVVDKNIGHMAQFSSSRDWNLFDESDFKKALKSFGTKTFGQEVQDTKDTIDLLVAHSKFLFNQEKIEISIVGGSLGGTIAATLSDKFNLIDKIILAGSPSKLKEKFHLTITGPSPRIIKKHARKFKGSVLLLQGEKDTIVPLKSGEKLLSFFENARSKKTIIVKGANHNFSSIDGKNKKKAFEIYTEEVIKFLK